MQKEKEEDEMDFVRGEGDEGEFEDDEECEDDEGEFVEEERNKGEFEEDEEEFEEEDFVGDEGEV